MATNTADNAAKATARKIALANFHRAENDVATRIAQLQLDLAHHHKMAHKEAMPDWIDVYTGQLQEVSEALDHIRNAII